MVDQYIRIGRMRKSQSQKNPEQEHSRQKEENMRRLGGENKLSGLRNK